MRFVHAADIHLDSPMLGLESYEGAPVEEFRAATRRALENLVDLCLEERADFLLIAGDLFDGEWPDYNTGLFFLRQIARLADAAVPVFIVKGNHDAQSRVTRSLRLPDGVHVFSADQSETMRIEGLRVALHGRSYPTQAVRENLAAAYPPPVPGWFNVGLLHTALDGRPGHDPYAPCSVAGLAARGYDYWALGHVHAGEVVSREPWVVYPGNLQGRNVRETGPRGAALVTVADQMVSAVEQRSLDAVRWARCRVDVSGLDHAEALVDRAATAIAAELEAAEGRTVAVRLVLEGACGAHAEFTRQQEHWLNELRGRLLEAGGGVWLEKVRVATRMPVDLDALARRDDPIGGLVRSLTDLRDSPEALTELAGTLSDLRQKLPREYLSRPGAADLADPVVIAELLGEAGDWVLPQLLAGEEP